MTNHKRPRMTNHKRTRMTNHKRTRMTNHKRTRMTNHKRPRMTNHERPRMTRHKRSWLTMQHPELAQGEACQLPLRFMVPQPPSFWVAQRYRPTMRHQALSWR